MGIRVTRLDSGLTVVTDAMPSVESASVGLWVGVGTRHETPAENGLAHLIEHMVFKGTRRSDAAAIAREIEAVGRSEEQTSELQVLMRISFTGFCVKNKNTQTQTIT